MFGISAIGDLIVTILKFVNMLHEHFNNPTQVKQIVAQMTENFSKQVNDLQAIIADPNKSTEEKNAAFKKLQLLGS